MSTLLMTLLCPVISPTEEPLSHKKTAPNLSPIRVKERKRKKKINTEWTKGKPMGKLLEHRPVADVACLPQDALGTDNALRPDLGLSSSCPKAFQNRWSLCRKGASCPCLHGPVLAPSTSMCYRKQHWGTASWLHHFLSFSRKARQ